MPDPDFLCVVVVWVCVCLSVCPSVCLFVLLSLRQGRRDTTKQSDTALVRVSTVQTSWTNYSLYLFGICIVHKDFSYKNLLFSIYCSKIMKYRFDFILTPPFCSLFQTFVTSISMSAIATNGVVQGMFIFIIYFVSFFLLNNDYHYGTHKEI